MSDRNKKEFNMEQRFALWLKKSKDGKTQYLQGKTQNGALLTGFFNGKKKNPKEPDVRIYGVDEDGKTEKEEYASLWVNVSKSGNKYLTGGYGEVGPSEKIVAFIRKDATVGGKIPYIVAYKREDQAPAKNTGKASKKQDKQTEGQRYMDFTDTVGEELPFN